MYLIGTGGHTELMIYPKVGILSTFAHWGVPQLIRLGKTWAGDNCCFTNGWQPEAFQEWLGVMQQYRDRCLFVACPDVVGDAVQTGALFREWRIHFDGWPVAFVCQDGQETQPWPPDDEYAAVFIGGTTDWKLGQGADECIRRAKRLGKWVHVGRVNSWHRFRHFALLGVDSVDGTAHRFKPDARIREIVSWIQRVPLLQLD